VLVSLVNFVNKSTLNIYTPTYITFQECQNQHNKGILNTYTPTYITLQECQNITTITPCLNTVLLLWVSFSRTYCLQHKMVP